MIQDMLAEMQTECDAARLLAYRALDATDRGERAPHWASMAKWYATEMAVRVTGKAVQIHGAYGLTEEFAVSRYYRDARMLTIPDGTTQIQKLIIGREMTGIDAIR
jgi:alkylation response protein AidB-like acyl-CoA dehydrogenase